MYLTTGFPGFAPTGLCRAHLGCSSSIVELRVATFGFLDSSGLSGVGSPRTRVVLVHWWLVI